MKFLIRLVAALKPLSLGAGLIIAAAAVLLLADLGARNASRAGDGRAAAGPLSVAIVQHTSIAPLEEGVEGVLEALAEAGFTDGGRMTVRRYNAEGDVATANAIAKDVTSGPYDMVITVSTVTLQTVANANQFATPPRTHIFGVTSDPWGLGVGISREDPTIHPPYMAGVGSLPPVRETFETLQQFSPGTRRIGLVWNPAEANSVAATETARRVTAELGLELIESNADTPTVAGEATAALLSRGIDALWLSPDQTTATAAGVMISTARRAGVPAFTSVPGHTPDGAVFDLGVDYHGVGLVMGQLAAEVLNGRDTAGISVDNINSPNLHLNLAALEGLNTDWQIPDSFVARALTVIDASGNLTTRNQAVD